MTNAVLKDNIYNEQVKEVYLDTLKAGSRKNLERIFKISYPVEFDLGKDLYKFTREELRKLFYTYICTTPSSSRTVVQSVITYINWAVDEGYTNRNPLASVDVPWKEQFVVAPEKLYWTDIEVKAMLKQIVNAQVAVVFYAPFLGIQGKANSEIVNLREKDINDDDLTVLLTEEDKETGKKETRTITVDQTFISLCRSAVREDAYEKSNGEPDKNTRSTSAPLIDNDYIVRSVDIGVKNFQAADGMVVYRRFVTVANFFDEQRLNPVSILYSGMLAMTKDLYIGRGKLDDEEFNIIAAQFNINKGALKRHQDVFLNIETIKELYNLA